MSAWYPIIGFGILAWVAFAWASKTSIGGDWADWIIGLVGIGSAIISGTYAAQTWVAGVVGFVVKLPIVGLIVFAGVFIAVIATLFALILNKWNSAVTASTGIALAWIILPSALAAGAIPGQAGQTIQQGQAVVSGALMTATAGWFG